MKKGSFTPNTFRIEGKIVWIKLTQGKETCIDLEDWELVRTARWYAARGKRTFYAATSSSQSGREGKPRLLHKRLLHDEKFSDHADRNGLNNCRSNLRTASRSQNGANQSKQLNNTSGFRGVVKRDNKWRARLMVSGVMKNLGSFETAKTAASAYDAAARTYFGDFAYQNFPAASETKSQEESHPPSHGLACVAGKALTMGRSYWQFHGSQIPCPVAMKEGHGTSAAILPEQFQRLRRLLEDSKKAQRP